MEQKLSRIQKRDLLNEVYSVDEKGPGGANHLYSVKSTTNNFSTTVQFQKGPRNKQDSVEGVLDTDLLEMVRDRYTAFQSGIFANKETEMALMHIENALLWLNKRVEDRAEREVLGTYNK